MKQINVIFDDEEFKDLIKTKDGLTWRTYIITLTNYYKLKSKKNKVDWEVVDGRIR